MAKAFAGGLYNEKSAPRVERNYVTLPEFDGENA